MSNYQVEPANKPQALTTEAIKAVRHEQVKGVSRRELLRGSLAAGLGIWLLEVTAGTIGFLWPNLEGKFGGDVLIGTLDDVKAAVPDLPVDQGFPAYFSSAKAFVILINPNQQAFIPGEDSTGDGISVNVRALYQRCPHLGCKPNAVREELLARVPVPRVALRPPRRQGGGRPVRPRAARHGPLRRQG